MKCKSGRLLAHTATRSMMRPSELLVQVSSQQMVWKREGGMKTVRSDR